MKDKSRILVRSGSTLRRLRNVSRDAIAAVAELERFEHADIFGRLRLRRPLSEREVSEFLHLALEHYPDQELELVVIAHVAEREDEHDAARGNGRDSGREAGADAGPVAGSLRR